MTESTGRLFRLGCCIGCGLILYASAACAQDVKEADSSAGGLSTGYQELLRERRTYRPVVPDSTVVQTWGDDPAGLEIDGLVVDETRTKIGRDFYDEFYGVWSPPEGAVNFTVTVKEQILPNRGTRIAVHLNEEIVFQAYLVPQYDHIVETARQAVVFTRQRLRDQNPVQLQY